MTEIDSQYFKDAAVFFYKVASRSFIALLTTLFLYFIYTYGAGFETVAERHRQARDLKRLMDRVYDLSSTIPFGLLDSVDNSKVAEILTWNFQHASAPEVKKQECDPAGCFFSLFTPSDTTLDIKEILSRFQRGLRVIRQGSVPETIDPRDFYLAWFIPLVNERDGQLLWKYGPRYATPKTRRESDSITFTQISLLHKSNPRFVSPDNIFSEWLPLISRLDSLNLQWSFFQDYLIPKQDADPGTSDNGFNLQNLKQVSQTFGNEAVPTLPKFQFSYISASAKPALLISGPIILIIMSGIFWFLREATTCETKYINSAANSLTNQNLSALASGVFYFFQSNARILKSHKVCFWPWISLLFCLFAFFVAPVLWGLFILVYVTREDATYLYVGYFILTILTALVGSSLFYQTQLINRREPPKPESAG